VSLECFLNVPPAALPTPHEPVYTVGHAADFQLRRRVPWSMST
jgi:hypothetical protein